MFEITLSDGVVVVGSYDKKGQPMISVKNIKNMPGVHTFEAAQWLDNARRGTDFRFGSNFSDESHVIYIVGKDTLKNVSSILLDCYDKKNGYFEVVFRNTANSPF